MIRGSDWGGSRLETAQTCKKMYYERYEREFPDSDGLKGIVRREDSLAAVKGTLCHQVLQHYYQRMLEEPSGDRRTFILEGLFHMQKSVDSFTLPDNLKPLLIDEVMAAMDQYFQRYGTCAEIKPIAVEQPVSFKFTTPDGRTLVHTGIIDLVGEWHGAAFIVDHKTTSLAFDALYRGYAFSLSFKGYCKAASEIYGKQIGILVNAIRFKKNKALEVEFEREPIIFTQQELDEFEPTVAMVRREIQMCQEANFWPKSSRQCSKPWGACEYLPLCKFDDPAMIRAMYKPANPLEATDDSAK